MLKMVPGYMNDYTMIFTQGGSRSPVAQKAKLGFKLLLFEGLNVNLKQKYF